MDSDGDNRFTHNFYTSNGHSGSPAYDNTYVAWGIHTNGHALFSYPSGLRFDTDLYNIICEKIDEGRLKYGYD